MAEQHAESGNAIDTTALVQAMRSALDDVLARDLSRMLGRICTAMARRARADVSAFLVCVDRLEADHRRTVAEAIEAPARGLTLPADAVVASFFFLVRRELLDLAGSQTSGASLADAIEERFQALRLPASQFAKTVRDLAQAMTSHK